MIYNALPKAELLKPNNCNIVFLLLQQACNSVSNVGTTYTVPNNCKCNIEYIPDDSYMII